MSCVECHPSKIGRCQNGTSTEESSHQTTGRYMAATEDNTDRRISRRSGQELCEFTSVHCMFSSKLQMGNTEPESIVRTINRAYEEIARWKRNLCRVPSGAIGKSFVREFTSLFVSYNEAAGMEQILLRAAMIMPSLLLQRCSSRMKTSEMKKSLERRIDTWKNAQIEELHKEVKALQLRAAEPHGRDTDNMAHRFANLVFQGRIKDALRLLSKNRWVAPFHQRWS